MQSQDSDDAFVSLLLANQSRIYRFLLSLVPQREDAEDLFQQTCLTLWHHRGKFDPAAGAFSSWACAIAHNHVRNFRRRETTRRLLLSDDTMDLLATTSIQESTFLDDCHRALLQCLDKLTPHQRSLVEEGYGERTIKDVAEGAGHTANALYKALRRIRHILHDCIVKNLPGKSAPWI